MSSVRMNTGISRMIAMVLLLILALSPMGLAAQSNMPFNGEIAFHKISLTIPSSYIRDSTQSTEDLWIFEKGFYSKYIMLSRKDFQGDVDEILDSYVEYLHEQGMNSQRDTFLELEAVRSESTQEEVVWREMLFVHDGALYAVAMRGGTEEELQALLDTVAVHDETPEIAVQPDNSTMFGRIFDYFLGE